MSFELRHDLKIGADRDSAARQAFVSQLRAYILNDMADAMRNSYETKVLPEFERKHGRAPATQDEIHEAMSTDAHFKFYSSVRYNAQEMVWQSVIPGVELLRISDIERFGNDVSSALMQKVAAEFRSFADDPKFMITESL